MSHGLKKPPQKVCVSRLLTILYQLLPPNPVREMTAAGANVCRSRVKRRGLPMYVKTWLILTLVSPGRFKIYVEHDKLPNYFFCCFIAYV